MVSTIEEPDCPKCHNNRQVWTNQITGKKTCHRAFCHTVIESDPSRSTPKTVSQKLEVNKNMTNNKLHCWALIRPDGTERASVEATNKTAATQSLRAIIRRGTLPKGWKVVDRGPEAPKLPANLTAEGRAETERTGTVPTATAITPEPRAFQMGDRVIVDNGCGHYFNAGDTGTMKDPDEDGQGGWIQFDAIRRGDGRWYASVKESGLRLLSPAPQPKAEEGKRPANLKEAMAALGVSQVRVMALEAQAISWQESLHAKDAEIATLKAEVEKLKKSRQNWEEAGKAEQERAEGRAEALEEKLNDIRALFRANTLMGDMPGEPTFGDAIRFVLER